MSTTLRDTIAQNMSQRSVERTWLSLDHEPDGVMRNRIAEAENGTSDDANDKKIAALKDLHRGKIGWLIGNGPSVRTEDLERLSELVSIGCNRLYLAYDRMNFRPTYLCSSDKQMIRDFGKEMVEYHPGQVLFMTEEEPQGNLDCTWFSLKSRTPLEFSENVYDFVMPGGGTLVAAAQVGYHMGITKFFLYGVDHHYTYDVKENSEEVYEKAQGDGNHFIQGYRSGKPWSPPVLWQFESALLASHVFLQSKGGWIKNATRGGKLELLDREAFSQALEYV